jgi:hypothetical protein
LSLRDETPAFHLELTVKLPQQLRLSGACGSGWNEPLVPDRFGDADFTSACRAHDACYETCGQEKSACDSRFHGDLRDACRSGYSGWWQAVGRQACFVAGEAYALAVQRMGGDAYRAAQRAAHC